MKRSKAWSDATKNISAAESYSLEQAVKLLTDNANAKFDETAEAHFSLGIDPRHSDQQIRSHITLPHSSGKTIRIVAICDDAMTKDAIAAGATKAGGDDIIEKITQGWTDFDLVLAAPKMMKSLAKAAKVLGPRGMMPNPKSGTVTENIVETIAEFKKGKMEFRNDKYGLIHASFGKISLGHQKLLENLTSLQQGLLDAKPSGQKGIYIKNISISSTMGPGISINLSANAS